MPDFWRMDQGLATVLRAREESAEVASAAEGISVGLDYEGDLAEIERLGFRTLSSDGRHARGIVRFDDMDAITAHPGVVWLTAGAEVVPHLDTAAIDIGARAANAADVRSDGNGLWHVAKTGGMLTALPKATGKGVIVAVIDSGIDYTHPMFMSQMTPHPATRILRIWDQGCDASAKSQCPGPTLLEHDPNAGVPSLTYGTEYFPHAIDQALHPGPPLRHVDRTGHGTHVAAIAAGGIHFTRRGDASRVGIAPEAFIIAVKFHDLRRPAVYHGTNIIVPVEQRLRDAVYYCLRTAHGMDMPVVVNMSFGRGSAAGDGLDPFAMFVDKLLDPTNAQVVAGPINTPMTFPKGAIVVRSAGNEGEKDRGARITIPASGSVVLPLVLDDSRILPTKATTAGELPHAPEISVQCWWRPEAAGPVRFAIRLPHLAGSSSEFSTDPMDADGNAPPLSAELCFDMLAGPPVTTHVVPSDPKAHAAIFRLEAPPPVVHSPGRTVRRRHLTFSLRPKTGGSVSYAVGNYALVIRGPPGIVIHVLCEKTRWEPQSFVTFRIPGTAGSAIQVGSAFSAVDALGRHAITVAAYDDKQGQNVPGRHAIYDSSARGPLRDFSDPANKLGPIAPKPDIAAPGVGITSALSASAPNLMGPLSVDWHAGNRFSTLTGTSLAGPIVAGVIATLLGKKPDLNTSEVRKKLRVHARAGVEPPLEATVDPSLPSPRERAYGAGMVDAFASFKNLLP